MKQHLILLSSRERLANELAEQLGSQYEVSRLATLPELEAKLAEGRCTAVLVHLEHTSLDETSAGRFVADLDAAISNVPLYALIDEDCPNRLASLAARLADESLPLPLEYDRLRQLVNPSQDLEKELENFWKEVPHRELHGLSRSLVTFTPEMFETLDEMQVAAKHDVTALLIGETGSGKTFLARLIHELSERREERFCTVACGALPPDLLESELFGHTKGSFTGADRNREGKFAAAGRGTLLLDEIDVLPPEHQAKLLRVIETGEYEQIGSNETMRSEARLIVASNYNLEDLVNAGTFRTDLYYRLNILCFHLLPLRERPMDIEYLARKFALQHSRTHNAQLKSIDADFLEALRRYNWPGNVREMENVIRRAVLYCQNGRLTAKDLPTSVRTSNSAIQSHQGVIVGGIGSRPAPPGQGDHYQQAGGGFAQPAGGYPRANGYPGQGGMGTGGGQPGYPPQPILGENGRDQYGRPAGAVNGNGGYPAAAGGNGGGHVNGSGGGHTNGGEAQSTTLEARVGELEQKIIEEALQRNNHRRKETAAELGISRVTLYNKMKKFSLL